MERSSGPSNVATHHEHGLLYRIVRGAAVGYALLKPGQIGAEMGIWLWALWIPYYHLMRGAAEKHIADHAAGRYVIPDSNMDLGPLYVTDVSAHGVVTGCLFVLAMLCLVGLVFGGWRWCKGMFYFWAPIVLIPVWSVGIGMHHQYPGGVSAYVNHYYVMEGCPPPSYQCVWKLGPHKPPF